VHRYFVLMAFIILIIAAFLQVLQLRQEGVHFLGKPTIGKYIFFTAKVALVISFGLFIMKAISPQTGYVTVPEFLDWIAVGLLWFGVFIILQAIHTLGHSLKIGLPDSETELKTTGVYHYSRNPMYTGAFIIGIASCLYCPDLINITFTLFGIYTHHRIIVQEEQFLSSRFGKDWEQYKNKVKRYL